MATKKRSVKKTKKKPKLHRYVVTVVRVCRESCTVEVLARSGEDAGELALEEADEGNDWELEDVDDIFVDTAAKV